MSEYYIGILILIGINLLAVLGLSLMTGFTGLFNFGQAGFLAVGAYTATILTTQYSTPFILALVAGMVVSVLTSFVIGYPTLRLKGDYFAIATLGFAEVVRLLVENLEKMDVNMQYNRVIGKIYSVDDLFEKGYDAVFIGTGAGLPNFMGIPGENLNGVYSANEYLTRANLMKAYSFPDSDTPIARSKNVAIVGGGNVAMDSARTALRLGAENVYLVYRRAREQMPARVEEVEHAEEEGVQFNLLRNPVRIIGDENGWVKEVECIKMELGEPDNSGRRRPIPIEGSEFTFEVDTYIVAIGNSSNPLIPDTTPDIETNRWGNIIADDETMKTSKKGVFSGGDIVLGAATVILAMGQGRKAAAAINEYLETGRW